MEEIHLLTLVFIFVFSIQAYFYFYYFLSFVNHNVADKQKAKAREAVSIIICAHNELTNLKDHLPLFLNQEFEDFELIVVNDRSTDGSEAWLMAQEEKHTRLKVVNIAKTANGFNPKKYALTCGIEAAKNELILLSDADCYPISSQWVDRMSQSFTTSTSIVLGASLYEEKNSLLNQFIRFETLQTALLYLSFAFNHKAYMGVGRNLAYRKSFFLANGGFEGFKSITGGDDDLWVNRYTNQYNTKVCSHAESIIFSKPKENWQSFFKQKTRHLSVGRYYKWKDQVTLGLFHLTQTLTWILFIFGLLLGSPTDCLLLHLLFLMYLAGQFVVYYKISIKFGIKFAYYKLPILEILFIFYYWIWGMYASLTKHVKWK
jgi:glycosyltransferase involved in cell wall biosynthesis